MAKTVEEHSLRLDYKLCLQYEILDKLGSGCFGAIFRCINRRNKKLVALKLENNANVSQRTSPLANEVRILSRLRTIKGIPKVYGAGRWACGYFMEMELLDTVLGSPSHVVYSQA
jgi:serine/threonine protein kinase